MRIMFVYGLAFGVGRLGKRIMIEGIYHLVCDYLLVRCVSVYRIV